MNRHNPDMHPHRQHGLAALPWAPAGGACASNLSAVTPPQCQIMSSHTSYEEAADVPLTASQLHGGNRLLCLHSTQRSRHASSGCAALVLNQLRKHTACAAESGRERRGAGEAAPPAPLQPVALGAGAGCVAARRARLLRRWRRSRACLCGRRLLRQVRCSTAL